MLHVRVRAGRQDTPELRRRLLEGPHMCGCEVSRTERQHGHLVRSLDVQSRDSGRRRYRQQRNASWRDPSGIDLRGDLRELGWLVVAMKRVFRAVHP